jgi:hypothetical protein
MLTQITRRPSCCKNNNLDALLIWELLEQTISTHTREPTQTKLVRETVSSNFKIRKNLIKGEATSRRNRDARVASQAPTLVAIPKIDATAKDPRVAEPQRPLPAIEHILN